MYRFKWPLCKKKCSVGFSMMKGNKICRGTNRLKAALRSGVTSPQVMVASARSVSRGSNEAVTLLYLIPCLKHSDIQSENTRFKHDDFHH